MQTIHAEVHSIIINASSFFASTGKESFKVFYFEAESDFANAQRPTWDSDAYSLVDVIAADRLFSDVADAVVNSERRSVRIDRQGLYLAFRDEGTCVTLLSVKVFYYECPAVVTSLAAFRRSSPAGADLSSVVLVQGRCVANAVSSAAAAAAAEPTYLCKADGSWYYYTGSCVCAPGYQPNENLTQCTGVL